MNMGEIRKLCIEIEDGAFQRMKSEMEMKIMLSNNGGAPDELVNMIIVAIDNDEEVIKIESKRKPV